MSLTDVEVKQNLQFDHDGINDTGLEKDPLYVTKAGDPLHLNQLYSEIKNIAPRHFTRHELDVDVQAAYLSSVLGREADVNDLFESGFNARGEEDIQNPEHQRRTPLQPLVGPLGRRQIEGIRLLGPFLRQAFPEYDGPEEGPDLVARNYAFDANGVDFFGLPDNQIGTSRSMSPPTATQVDRSLSTPYTDELTLGFERELAPELSLSVTYVQRDYRNQLQNIDLNHTTRIDPITGRFADNFGLEVQPGGFGEESSAVPSRQKDGKPDLYIQNIFFNRVYRLGNFNQQSYRGVELEVVRRLSRKWQLNGSYTRSRTEGDAESFLSDNGDDPTLTEFESGYLNYDQRHVVKVNATTYLPGDWQIGGTGQWASGLPYSVIQKFNSDDDVGYVQSRKRFGVTDSHGVFISENRNSHRNHAAYLFNAGRERALSSETPPQECSSRFSTSSTATTCASIRSTRASPRTSIRRFFGSCRRRGP
jgi:hypothetical protein